MKLALMQPYLFPYLGYYQLAASVDEFVFYDDAAFIKQGYINRNAILLSGQRHEFSVPVRDISSYRMIGEHVYQGRFDVLLKQLKHAYAKAPYFTAAYALIEGVLLDADLCVARKNAKSLTTVLDYLSLPRTYSYAAGLGIHEDIRAEARVIEVCRRKQAKTYRNAIGGQSLYDAQNFADAGIELQFVKPRLDPYKQGKYEFEPGLSIIDALMWCSPQQVCDLVSGYQLVCPAHA